MKIGILTHPLGTNYGGILQCYALYSYLKSEGHNPIIIHRQANKSFFLWRWIRYILKKLHFPRYYTAPASIIDRIANIRPFIQNHLILTAPIQSSRDVNSVCGKYGFEAVVVGSDQVWRADFASKYGFNYFLDFVPSDVIKFSYAASFGVSTWGYSTRQTKKIRRLLKSFNGISVREEDGIKLCEENLGVTPQLLIDPTLLISADEYSKISSQRLVDGKYVFVYWLGDNLLVKNDIENLENKGYKIININLRDKTILPSVEDWLSYIKYADIVLTDSFHGCVFSIIFQRSFIIKNNQSGGYGRLKTLFKLLNIDGNPVNQESSSIDYMAVSHNIENLQSQSKRYIQSIIK